VLTQEGFVYGGGNNRANWYTRGPVPKGKILRSSRGRKNVQSPYLGLVRRPVVDRFQVKRVAGYRVELWKNGQCVKSYQAGSAFFADKKAAEWRVEYCK